MFSKFDARCYHIGLAMLFIRLGFDGGGFDDSDLNISQRRDGGEESNAES